MELTHTRKIWGRCLIGGLTFILVAAGGWYLFADRKRANAGESDGNGDGGPSGVWADVVHPEAGGIPRICSQPGSVEPYANAALYAKVFGQLKKLTVDIGSQVKEGDLLAVIDIPEREADVTRNEARVRDAKAKLKQCESQKIEAEAEARAADSAVELAGILVKARTAFREYRAKQRDRIKDLVKRTAEDQRLLDEQEEYYLSALEGENGAREKVNTTKEQAAAAKAKIQRVDADIAAAKADIEVADAELATSRVWVAYGTIKSPYTGVITQRGYKEGDFIKTGDVAGNVPIVTVSAIDKMRVVIPVPDRDVPFVVPENDLAPGHGAATLATLTFDAFPDEVFTSAGGKKLVVSRMANAEDYETRLMRTEVDFINTDGRLKQGMYGRARLTLSEGAKGAVHIPSGALTSRGGDGKGDKLMSPSSKYQHGTVRIVRDGKLATVPVHYGMDDGVHVEIVTGLTTNDQVVIGTNVPAVDGTAVTVRISEKNG